MIKNYINGELIEPVSEKYFDNFDPAIGEAYGIVPDSDERDIAVSYTHLRAHETVLDLVCRLLLEKKHSSLLSVSTTICY